MIKNCLLTIGVVIIIVAIYFPDRHARHYNYINKENILKQIKLQEPTTIYSNLRSCTYQDIILNNVDVEIKTITDYQPFQRPFSGGEFKPKECVALIKSALIVPYRNRTEQLHIFLNYMHHFLQRQRIHYRIFIVDQNDTLPFNRAKMLNYGAKLAISLNYDCLILHDIDLLPLNTGNLYGCAKSPRHMSSSLDTFRYGNILLEFRKFLHIQNFKNRKLFLIFFYVLIKFNNQSERYNLPYLTLFGGAISILSQQYQKINGMSNTFYGWGAEDDDFYRRMVKSGFKPCRFSPEISRYTMLKHKKEKANEDRYKLLESAAGKSKTDGLNSLPHQYSIKLEELYTHMIVS